MNQYEQSIVDRLRDGLRRRHSVTLGANEVHIPMNAMEENEKLRADLACVTAERNTAVESALFHSEQCEKQAADIKRLRAALEEETSRRYQAECNYDKWKSQCARVIAQRDAAIAEMKRIVDAVREEHCDETCCFACKYDCDTSITDTGDYACECPGFERDDCFEWRGVKEATHDT